MKNNKYISSRIQVWDRIIILFFIIAVLFLRKISYCSRSNNGGKKYPGASNEHQYLPPPPITFLKNFKTIRKYRLHKVSDNYTILNGNLTLSTKPFLNDHERHFYRLSKLTYYKDQVRINVINLLNRSKMAAISKHNRFFDSNLIRVNSTQF